MTISAEVDERTLREIHLVAFEHAVQEAGVWSVMTAYNKVNGVYCGEQPDLINGVLAAGLGLRRAGHVRLVRDALDRGGGGGRARPRDAGPVSLARTLPGGGGAFRGGRRVGGRRPGAPRAAADGAGGDPRRRPDSVRRGRVRRPRAAGGRASGGDGGDRPPGQRRVVAVGRRERRQRGRDRAQRRPAGHGRRQFRGDAAPAPTRGRGAGGAAPGCLHQLRGRLPHRSRACRRSTCACSAKRRCGSTTSTTSPWRARRWRRRRHIRPGSCGSAPRSRDSPWARARPRLSATFTPDVSGAWQLSLESAGRSVLRLDGAVVVDNTEPVRGSSFYGAGSEPVDVTVDLAAGHSYELTVDIWPRSLALPHHGSTHRRLAPGHGRRVRARGGRRGRGRRRRGRGRLQRAMGVRGPRPTRPLAARPPTRARRGGARGQPAHRGGRQRGLPRRDALGVARRCRAHDLVPGRGGCGRAGRHAGRSWPSRRAGSR